MSATRYASVFSLLASCASTVSGSTAASDAALDSAPTDSASLADATAVDVVNSDQAAVVDADPLCPQRPCRTAPLLRSGLGSTWLVYPDGRTLFWGAVLRQHASAPNEKERYYEATPGPQLSDDIVDLAIGGYHFCALGAVPRRVICWGSNVFGQLGRGNVSDYEDPAVVDGLTGVSAIAAFDLESWALNQQGAFAWGSTRRAGPDGDLVRPRRYGGAPSNVVRFATGFSYDGWGFLTSDGAIFAYGYNGHFVAGVARDGHVTAPTRLAGLPPAIDYSTGGYSSCAVVASGEVYCWGQRADFLTHHGEPPADTATPERVAGIDDAVRVYVGNMWACALTRARSVRCWGRNNWDRPDGGPSLRNSVSVPPGPAYDLPPVRELVVAGEQACALTMDGDVYCWGANYLGSLGIRGFGRASTLPLRVPLPP